jgi:hypothetical protein
MPVGKPAAPVNPCAAPTELGRNQGAVVSINRALLTELSLLDRREDVTVLMRDLKSFEERQVFIPEAFASMVLYLIPNVVNHSSQLGVRVGEGAKTFLP